MGISCSPRPSATATKGPVEGGQAHLVEPKRAGQGILPEGAHRLRRPENDARLGSTQKLVPGEADQVDTAGEASGCEGLGRQPSCTEIEQGSAAQILDHGNASLPADLHQGGQLHLGHEAPLLEVAPVHL